MFCRCAYLALATTHLLSLCVEAVHVKGDDDPVLVRVLQTAAAAAWERLAARGCA